MPTLPVSQLPAADELRRIPVERPPDLLTVEPGLATAPPAEINTAAATEAAAIAAEATEATADPKPPEKSQ